MSDELNNLMVDLQCKRDMLNTMKENYYKAKEEFETRNMALISSYDMAKDALAEVEGKIRVYALDHFDGENKKIGFGVGIQIKKELTYDKMEALAWAREHGMCLKLDEAAFKKIANAQPLVFVDYGEKATATIPSAIIFE